MFEVHSVERPYPGLRPFEPWESSIFFGRETHTDRLLEILDRQHFLVVTGPSGSGKSSLVRAGLVPALPLGTIGRGASWRVAMMRPGDRPLHRLTQSLLEPEAFGTEVGIPPRPPEDSSTDHGDAHIQAELSRGPRGLADLVTDMRAHVVGDDFDLLILVDQFEEIFTYSNAGGRDADEADAFVNLLLSAAEDKSCGVFVVLTMRTDFLGNCTRFLKLPDAINHAGFLTPRLSRNELTNAIAAPARVFSGNLDPDLTGELVNEVSDDPDQLPVLQHALARMWDKRVTAGDVSPLLTLQDLQSAGGIDEAISQHADEVLSTLKQKDDAGDVELRAQWLFRCISDQRSAESGGQLVRRPQALWKIEEASGIPWQKFTPILRAFSRTSVNFVTYPGQPGEPERGRDTVVDISHEALLRQWSQLRKWVAAEAKAVERYRELQRRTVLEGGSLLTGPDLTMASDWFSTGLGFAGAGLTADRSRPTAEWARRIVGGAGFGDVERYFQDSLQAAARQKRKDRNLAWSLRGGVVALAVLGLISSGFGYRSYTMALDANAQALWHRLQFDGRSGLKGEDIIEGLLSLARADRSVRREAIHKWIDNNVLARQLANSRAYVLDAALGLDQDLRDALIRDALIHDVPPRGDILLAQANIVSQFGLTDHVDIIFRAIADSTDSDQLDALGQGLAHPITHIFSP